MGDESVKTGLASILAGDLKTDDLYRQMGLQPPGSSAPPAQTSTMVGSAKKSTDKVNKKKKGFWGGLFGAKEAEEESTPISGPTNFKREMHIGFDPQTGSFEVGGSPQQFAGRPL